MSETYKIVRFWKDGQHRNTIIRRGLTLQEAREHCSRMDTHKEGVWFDGFTRQ